MSESEELSYLRSVIAYAPILGRFRWLVSGHRRTMSREPGYIFVCGCKTYRAIGIRGKRWMAHRLAVYLMLGVLPEADVDHIDGNGLNNVYTNLRPATRIENLKNKKVYSSNTSGYPGVRRGRNGKCSATIGVGNTKKWIGSFATFVLAREARIKAEREFGFHINHGRKA